MSKSYILNKKKTQTVLSGFSFYLNGLENRVSVVTFLSVSVLRKARRSALSCWVRFNCLACMDGGAARN